MSFWDKLNMYMEAIGVHEAGTAWDLASAPLGDADHKDFALMLLEGNQQ